MSSVPDPPTTHTPTFPNPRDPLSTYHHLLTRSHRYLDHNKAHPDPNTLAFAVRDAAAATQLFPHLPAAWLALSSAHLAADDLSAAIATLDKAASFCPSDPLIPLVRHTLAVSPTSNPTPPDTPQQPRSINLPTPPDRAATPSDSTPTTYLRIAKAALASANYDDALLAYTRLLAWPALAENTMVSALAGRSDAYLFKARHMNDQVYFSRAAADAKRLVAMRPNWEDAWIRLGAAHLENGCPARARHTFRLGVQACQGSIKLKEGLKDAQFVIDSEGCETDWEEEDTVAEKISESSEGTSEEGVLNFRERKFRGWGRSEATEKVATDAAPRSLDFGIDRRLGRNNSRKRLSAAVDRRRMGWERKGREWSEADARDIKARQDKERRDRLRKARESRSWVKASTAPAQREQNEDEELQRCEKEDETEPAQEADEETGQQYEELEDITDSSVGLGSFKLYDLLQVSKTATEASIKRSYYNLARKYHPDKNQDDSEATEKFQKLAEAYRVLSDPESRAVYDKYGDKGLVKNSVDIIDPSTLFAMVFGSDKFVNLIGELELASLACNVDENGTAPSNELLTSLQKQRVGKLVLEMVKTLKPYVDGDKKGFLSNTHRQMRRLKQASFGPSLLYTVGNVYVTQTNYLLDKTKPFNLSAVMRKASLRSHRIASQHRAMSAAARVMDKQKRLHDRVMKSSRDHRSISDEEAKKIAEEMAQNAIDMMWKISVIDIETTLEDVVSIVLSGRDLIADEDVPISLDKSAPDSPGYEERSRRRLRIGSHLGMDRRDHGDRGRDHNERTEVGLVRHTPALSHGQVAVTRQQILSERAHGIQAMGRIFMSAVK